MVGLIFLSHQELQRQSFRTNSKALMISNIHVLFVAFEKSEMRMGELQSSVPCYVLICRSFKVVNSRLEISH